MVMSSFFDADALFVRFDEDMTDLIEKGKDLYLVKHEIEGRVVPNTGAFLIRNSKWSRNLLDAIWNKKEYIDHPWWENAAIIDLFGYHVLLAEQKPNNFNYKLLEKVRWLDLKWNSIFELCETDDKIIEHFAGRPYEYRQTNMRHSWQEIQKTIAGV